MTTRPDPHPAAGQSGISHPGAFPGTRLRRTRRHDFSRRLTQEHHLRADDLIYPVFVHEDQGEATREPVPVGSMPGVHRHTIDQLLRVAEQCMALRIPVMALFPVIDPALKTPDGALAADPDGLVPRTVQAIKARFPELGIMTDVALDPYTSHGQDGLIDEQGYVLNDETLAMLTRQALTQAQAGVDWQPTIQTERNPVRQRRCGQSSYSAIYQKTPVRLRPFGCFDTAMKKLNPIVLPIPANDGLLPMLQNAHSAACGIQPYWPVSISA